MGLLDEVIGAAIGSRSASGLSSPIATALMALLASRMSAGSAAPSGALGGLGGLIDRFRNNGFEDTINSWIGTGQNQAIAPNELRQALGHTTVEDPAQQTGLSHGDLLAQLAHILPGVVDRLTPSGQLPSDADLLPGPR